AGAGSGAATDGGVAEPNPGAGAGVRRTLHAGGEDARTADEPGSSRRENEISGRGAGDRDPAPGGGPAAGRPPSRTSKSTGSRTSPAPTDAGALAARTRKPAATTSVSPGKCRGRTVEPRSTEAAIAGGTGRGGS